MELCECANCDHLLVLRCHLSCDVTSLLKSSILVFLDVDLYLQSDLVKFNFLKFIMPIRNMGLCTWSLQKGFPLT